MPLRQLAMFLKSFLSQYSSGYKDYLPIILLSLTWHITEGLFIKRFQGNTPLSKKTLTSNKFSVFFKTLKSHRSNLIFFKSTLWQSDIKSQNRSMGVHVLFKTLWLFKSINSGIQNSILHENISTTLKLLQWIKTKVMWK